MSRTLREAAQMALDALLIGYHRGTHDAITALREALAAPEPEPVAYLVEGWHDGKLIAHIPRLTLEDAKASAAVFSQHYTTTKLVPLHAAPPAAPAPAAPVPDGWVMVPREPTPEMLAVVRNGPMHETWTEGYCAMIAASPAAPVVPAVPLSCNKVPPGNGYCDHCARGEYEKCRYTTPAAPVVPLTDEQILSMWKSSEFRGKGGQADWFCEGIRAAEAHHGITGGKP